MVSKGWTRRAPPLRHQSKIYTESNQSAFSQIFGDLTSMQTLAIYRRLLVRDRLREQPQRLRGPSQCFAMCATDLKRDDRGREMFFLLRLAFWLGLVLVLLPKENSPESDKLPQVGASEAVSAATAAVSDMSQFCKRQPAACEVGGQAATGIGHRAQDGARKLYKIITDKKSPDHTGSIGGADVAEAVAEGSPRDTLTADDMTVEWQVPPTP